MHESDVQMSLLKCFLARDIDSLSAGAEWQELDKVCYWSVGLS